MTALLSLSQSASDNKAIFFRKIAAVVEANEQSPGMHETSWQDEIEAKRSLITVSTSNCLPTNDSLNMFMIILEA